MVDKRKGMLGVGWHLQYRYPSTDPCNRIADLPMPFGACALSGIRRHPRRKGGWMDRYGIWICKIKYLKDDGQQCHHSSLITHHSSFINLLPGPDLSLETTTVVI